MSGITVRRIERAEDAKHVMPLLREFFKDTRHSAFVELDEEAVQKLVETMVEDKDVSAVFAAVEDGKRVIGTTGGMLYPLWFAPDHRTGNEMFWYVAPDKRKTKAGKKLFEALEQWAIDSGAGSFHMACLAGDSEKRVMQMYAAKGYDPTERHFVKEL
jgi:GNAT superfamily N-acetyltransferase